MFADALRATGIPVRLKAVYFGRAGGGVSIHIRWYAKPDSLDDVFCVRSAPDLARELLASVNFVTHVIGSPEQLHNSWNEGLEDNR
jgi:hypothetical protein